MQYLVAIVVGAAAFFAISLLFALPFMLLWNFAMPQIFNLPEIGFFQAVALLMISSMLFRNTSSSS